MPEGWISSFNFIFTYLKNIGVGVGRARNRDLPPIGSLPRWPQQPGLIQAEVKSFILSPTLVRQHRIWANFCCFPRHTSREPDQKQNHQDSAQCQMKYQDCRQQLNQLYHNASPNLTPSKNMILISELNNKWNRDPKIPSMSSQRIISLRGENKLICLFKNSYITWNKELQSNLALHFPQKPSRERVY